MIQVAILSKQGRSPKDMNTYRVALYNYMTKRVAILSKQGRSPKGIEEMLVLVANLTSRNPFKTRQVP